LIWMQIRVAGIVPESVVDGPGIRFVVFVQGCPHHCPQCHNPETHDFQGGQVWEVAAIIDQFQELPMIAGITISGGEPFCQAEACAALARAAKKMGKNVNVYSGYTYEQLTERARRDAPVRELLHLTDLLIDGPYMHERRDLNLAYRGSPNQRIIDVPESLENGTVVEWKGR